jgi:hypothetical protein
MVLACLARFLHIGIVVLGGRTKGLSMAVGHSDTLKKDRDSGTLSPEGRCFFYRSCWYEGWRCGLIAKVGAWSI